MAGSQPDFVSLKHHLNNTKHTKSQHPPKTGLNRIVSIFYDNISHLNLIDFLHQSGIMERFYQSSKTQRMPVKVNDFCPF